MLMVTTEIAIFLGLIGAAMGSFAGAMAWRLKTKRNMVNDRSECEHCHHKLGILDLLPIVSWLLLGGRCRYCNKPIGWLPFVAEVGVAAAFVVSYLYWPLGFEAWQAIVLLVLWLVYLVALAVLIIYDVRWMILPDKIVIPLIVVGFIDASLRMSQVPGAGIADVILGAGYGVLALAGVYGALYAVSKGRWVGFGDVKLSIFIGVVLGWQKALLVLILANVIGFLIVVPGLATRKLTRTSRVPFGPFLIIAFVVAGLFGDAIIRWYMSFLGL
jgi:prepilin signal peptidase PulO-like enzyme (type II secretory pathway)